MASASGSTPTVLPRKLKTLAPNSDLPKLICFAVRPQGLVPQKRAKFSEQRRREVSSVRRKRACLRCKLAKVAKCSGGDPCSRCLQIVSSADDKKVLRFCYCIRTQLKDVSIFEYHMPPVHQRDETLSKVQYLPTAHLTLSFASLVSWKLDNLTSDMMSWISSTQDSHTSKVGLLSSPDFLLLVQSFIGTQGSLDFQRMLYAQSLAYTQQTLDDKHYLSIEELQQIAGLAGHNFLINLDQKLRPGFLASCSRNGLQALLLAVLGTILAVGYTLPVSDSPMFPEQDGLANPPGLRSKSLYTVVKEHLCCTLAHYVVYLGSKLGHSIHGKVEQFLIDAAHTRWQKQGLFFWESTGKEDERNEAETDRGAQIISVLNASAAPSDQTIRQPRNLRYSDLADAPYDNHQSFISWGGDQNAGMALGESASNLDILFGKSQATAHDTDMDLNFDMSFQQSSFDFDTASTWTASDFDLNYQPSGEQPWIFPPSVPENSPAFQTLVPTVMNNQGFSWDDDRPKSSSLLLPRKRGARSTQDITRRQLLMCSRCCIRTSSSCSLSVKICFNCQRSMEAVNLRIIPSARSWYRDLIHAQHDLQQNSQLQGGETGANIIVRRPKKCMTPCVFDSSTVTEEDEQNCIGPVVNLLV